MTGMAIEKETETPGPDARPHLGFLVVDDDELFNDAASQIVADLGHIVVGQAFDGAGAVKIFAEKQQFIDVVLMDVIMPGLNGVLAAAEMRRINPSKKFILMSGDNRNGRLVSALGEVGFLRKPFGRDAVKSTIELGAQTG